MTNQDPKGPRHRYQGSRARRRKRRSLLPILLLLLALVLLVGILFTLVGRLSRRGLSGVGERAVVLDEGWTAQFLNTATTEEQQAWIDLALADAAGWGADTILWTARAADGSALFRDTARDGLETIDTVTENDSFLHKFDPLAYLVKQAKKQELHVALLATSDEGAEVAASRLEDLCSAGVARAAERYGLQLCAPVLGEDSSILTYNCVSAPGKEATAAFLRCDASPALLATALAEGKGSRVILGSHTALTADGTAASLLAIWFPGETDGETAGLLDLSAYLGGRSIGQTLSLASPTSTVYTETCFLMGTSDPALPLTIRGGTVGDTDLEVTRYGTQGVWGYLVSLAEGDNVFVLSQTGGETLNVTVTRGVAAAATPTTPVSDGSLPASWGQKVQVTDVACASLLSDYSNADSIQGTLYEGAVMTVYNSERFQSGTSLTYAYQLENGSYVLSKNVTLLDPDTPNASFTGISIREDAETNCTVLDFAGSGTPAAFHLWEGNALALTFDSAAYIGAAPATGDFITGSEVTYTDTGFTLTLTFSEDDPLYGWFVQYDQAANTTSLWLKHQPQLSTAETGPLTGVRVLLDAGHGDSDSGAMGSAGLSAPLEKDLNLAETMAAKYRLEQLGATVYLTRSDDTFLTLHERLAMVNDLKPDFFLALHHNSATLTSDMNEAGGVECYWFYTEGRPLAEQLVTNLCAATGRSSRGAQYNYYFVTRTNICPAVLLESGFLTNPAEYENCADTEMLWSEAGAIAQSVLECVSGIAAQPNSEG